MRLRCDTWESDFEHNEDDDSPYLSSAGLESIPGHFHDSPLCLPVSLSEKSRSLGSLVLAQEVPENEADLRLWAKESGLPENSRFLQHW